MGAGGRRRARWSRSCTGSASTAAATSTSPTRFTAAGIAVSAIDLRGHGTSPGRARRRRASRRPSPTSTRSWQRCGERGAPVFVYGHSLGALLAALWLVRRSRRRRSRARSSRRSGSTARCASRRPRCAPRGCSAATLPKVRVKSGIDPATLSRDPEVVRAYRARQARPRHRLAGLRPRRARGDRRRSPRARRGWRSRCSSSTAGEDQVAYASGARELAALAPAVTTLHVYDGLFHEIHHEPEQERVLDDVLAWIDLLLGN